MSAPLKVSDSSFQADVLNSKKPVVLDFWAEWCGPCRMIAPSLEELAAELGDKVTIAKINIDENPRRADEIWRARRADADDLFSKVRSRRRRSVRCRRSKIKEWIEASI